MHPKPNGPLPARYAAALLEFAVEQVSPDYSIAHELGKEAHLNNLGTLDVARMHNDALASLVPETDSQELRKEIVDRAALFFNEAVTVIESTHRGALENAVELQDVNASLYQCTSDLADSRREVKREIVDRQAFEASLATSDAASAAMLAESRRLEEHLQAMTRQILTATEEERKRMSVQLQDEIAQTLLGINVRLGALKKEVSSSHEGLATHITTTQQLVKESAEAIRRYATELGIQHEP